MPEIPQLVQLNNGSFAEVAAAGLARRQEPDVVAAANVADITAHGHENRSADVTDGTASRRVQVSTANATTADVSAANVANPAACDSIPVDIRGNDRVNPPVDIADDLISLAPAAAYFAEPVQRNRIAGAVEGARRRDPPANFIRRASANIAVPIARNHAAATIREGRHDDLAAAVQEVDVSQERHAARVATLETPYPTSAAGGGAPRRDPPANVLGGAAVYVREPIAPNRAAATIREARHGELAAAVQEADMRPERHAAQIAAPVVRNRCSVAVGGARRRDPPADILGGAAAYVGEQVPPDRAGTSNGEARRGNVVADVCDIVFVNSIIIILCTVS